MTRLTPAVLVFLSLACGDAGPGGGERATGPVDPTTRDSAGVTIHEHPADALERAPLISIDSMPLAVIGSDDVDEDVTRIFGMVFLGGDRVAGFDAMRGAVRFFDASGTEVASHGRSGQGPGEFASFSVTVAVAGGDTLVVSDVSNGRLSLLTEADGVFSQHTAGFRNGGESHNVVGRFANGDWVLAPSNMLAARSAGEEVPPRRAPMAIGRLDSVPVAGRFDTLVVVPGTEMMRYRSKFGPREDLVDGVPAFGARTYVAAWDGHAAVMTNESWRIDRYDGAGRLVSMLVIAGPRQPVNDSVVTLWRESTLERARAQATLDPERGAEALESAEFYLDNAARADSVPPFMAANSSGGRLLWLMAYPVARTDSIRYTAVHADGRIIGRLMLPPMTRVVGFADDRLAIRTEDDDGIARFAVHRLVMPQ